MQQRYAAIDIGTVTCRLMVAEVVDGSVYVLRREHAITDLGEGVAATGRLKPEAMQRVADVIDRYRTIIDGFEAEGPVKVVALATSASRDAENADEFVAMLAQRGIELTVIPGSREAALTFLGATSAFVGEHLLVVDIGGGSTELVYGAAGCEPSLVTSFDVGCRRMTEEYLPSDPPTQAELDTCTRKVRQMLEPYFARLKAEGGRVDTMVAVAGTATTVVSVADAMEVYDGSKVHGRRVSPEMLEGVYGRFARVDTATRKAIVGLEAGRAPVIVAGMVILTVVLQLAQTEYFVVSESDILQGMILEASR